MRGVRPRNIGGRLLQPPVRGDEVTVPHGVY